MSFALNDTPYDGAALAPAVPADWFERHRQVHHLGYTRRVNALIAAHPQLQDRSVEDILRQIAQGPAAIREELAFEAGGHANHQFLWKILGPATADNQPFGELLAAINRQYGSFRAFRQAFEQAALALHGPGWAFLSRVTPGGVEALEIVVLAGNGSVLPIGKPGILVCDLWEHAYEREHGDDRAAWLRAYWSLVSWAECERRLTGLREGRMHL